MEIADLAYAAGFIDGEGCITILAQHKQRMRNRSYSLRIQITQVDPAPLIRLQALFGGKLRARSRPKAQRTQYDLVLNDKQAVKVLQLIRPYLIVKAEQADIALEFDKFRFQLGQVGRGGLSDETLDWYETYKIEISRLKHILYDAPTVH